MGEELEGGRRRRNGAKRHRTTTYRSFTLDDVDLIVPAAGSKNGKAAVPVPALAEQENIVPPSQKSKGGNGEELAPVAKKVKSSEAVPMEKKRKAGRKRKGKKAMEKVEEDEEFALDAAADGEGLREGGVGDSALPISIEQAFPYLKKDMAGIDDVEDLEDELSRKDTKSLSHAEHYQKYKLLKLRKKIDTNYKVTDLEFVFAVVSEVVQLEVEKADALPDEEKQLQQQALQLYLESVRSELNVYLNRGEDYYQVIQEYKDAKQRVANARQSILEEEKENRLLNTLLGKERALYKETNDKTSSDKAVQVFVEGIERIVNASG